MHSNTTTPLARRSNGAPRRPLGFGILLFGIYLGFGILGFGISARSASVTLTIDTSHPAQPILGFGASGCWWAQEVGAWPKTQRREIMRLLFDKQTGLGLTIYRHNLGADSYADTTMRAKPNRHTESMLDTTTGRFDWSRDANARRVMREAVDAGASEIILFVNSPPVNMTINKHSYGPAKDATNLAPARYADFAAYLADITAHFLNVEKLPVTVVSPLNEPEWDWATKRHQEGNHNTPAQTAATLRAVYDEFKRRALPVRVEGPEGGSYESTIPYFEAINADPVLRAGMKDFAVHSYWSNNAQREKFLAWLDKNRPDARVHMTEWCEMKSGDAPGMDSALVMANTIIDDFTKARATTWQYWTAVHEPVWHAGLLYFDNDARKYTLTKRYWVYGQFTRYLEKNSVVLPLKSSDKRAPAMAARLPDGRVAVIAANLSNENKNLSIKFPANKTETWRQQQRVITDAANNNAETPASDVLPAQSVVTIIFQKS